jgi:cell wall-associated NlpC family hydrolase
MTAAPDAIVARFIGVPYAPDARGPDALDCWGLVLSLRAALGLPVPPDFGAPLLSTRDLRARLTTAAPPVAWGAPGSIAYSERACHAGIAWRGVVVHAIQRAGVVAWSLPRWRAVFPDAKGYEWPA